MEGWRMDEWTWLAMGTLAMAPFIIAHCFRKKKKRNHVLEAKSSTEVTRDSAPSVNITHSSQNITQSSQNMTRPGSAPTITQSTFSATYPTQASHPTQASLPGLKSTNPTPRVKSTKTPRVVPSPVQASIKVVKSTKALKPSNSTKSKKPSKSTKSTKASRMRAKSTTLIRVPSASSRFSNREVSEGSGAESEDDEALSEREALKDRHLDCNAEPEVPAPSDSELEEASSRPALTFKSRGRVHFVPSGDRETWPTDRNRLNPNPERREHVLRTIYERGGWIIDRSAGTTPRSKKKTNYVFCPPTAICPSSATSEDHHTS